MTEFSVSNNTLIESSFKTDGSFTTGDVKHEVFESREDLSINILAGILNGINKLNETMDDIKVWINNYNL